MQTPKRHFLERNDAFCVLSGSDLTYSATCGFGKKNKKDTPRQWQTAIRPDHPHRRIEVKVCMPGGLRCVVLYFKFSYNRSSIFAAVGARKSPLPITLVIGLYNSLYYRISRDSGPIESHNGLYRTPPVSMILNNPKPSFQGHAIL